MFYRVRANKSLRQTYVFDHVDAASAVYEVLRNSDDNRIVEFECVADDGEILTVITTQKEQGS